MITRKTVKLPPTKFSRVYELQVGTFTIVKGDIIKIQDQHGQKFKFDSVVTNTENGKTWVDCFEIEKGSAAKYCSFAIERVKRIPTRRGKRVKKNVN
jgi:hypothetical protein